MCAITATLFQTSRLCRILSSTFHFFSPLSLSLSFLPFRVFLHTHLALRLSFFHFNRHRSVYSSLSPCTTLPSTTLNGLLSRYSLVLTSLAVFEIFNRLPFFFVPFLSFLFSAIVHTTVEARYLQVRRWS